LCSHQEPVYARDFFPVIDEAFRETTSTYTDAQSKLSLYQVYREDPKTEEYKNITTFYTEYDLRGDHEAIIALVFNREDILQETRLSLPDNENINYVNVDD
jgi:hypothetical protein